MIGNARRIRRRLSTSLLLALPLAGIGLTAVAATPAAAAGTGTVTVVHGVPGLPVDVYVNGKETLSDFQPGSVTAPLSLPAGSYAIAIRKAGSAASSAPAISGNATLPAGANVSLVAHLSASGTPELSAFVNDVSAPPSGEARLYVRHTAAAPAVDVLAGGKAVVTGLTNPQSKSLTVPAGTVSAAVALAGSTTPVIGPASLTLAPGSTTAVYAIGSASAKTLAFVVQKVTAAPTSAQAGTGGQAASGGGMDVPLVAGLGAAGVGALALSVRRLRRAA